MPELFGRGWERRELARRVGRLDQLFGVRLVELGDGGGRGVRVLEFRTGTGFEFDVLVDRAFDVGRCALRGIPLAWESAVGPDGPWFAEHHEELSFFRTWAGGLVTTCGIEHTLGPAVDTAEQYHYPGRTREVHGLHGRVSNRPARLAGYGARWEGGECVLWAEGETRVATVFGEQLELRRRIEARAGESRLRIADEVANVGWDPTPHMLLYHVNAGFPVVDEGAEVLVPATHVQPVDDSPLEGRLVLRAPEAGFVEHVYAHEVAAEPEGTVPAAVVNRALGVGLYEVFRRDQLPHHFLWRCLAEGQYAVGIEPCTNRVEGRLAARERGELIVLAPGESRRYDLELGALDGPDAIDAFAARVERTLVGSRL